MNFGIERWLGLDIGGANIKAASSDGQALSRNFALWKQPELLQDELTDILSTIPANNVAITMTGELADCFANKKQGVEFICRTLQSVSEPAILKPADCHESATFIDLSTCSYGITSRSVSNSVVRVVFYQTNGEFVSTEKAIADWHLTAASNWHALGKFAGRRIMNGLLIDIGSTTTDLIPIVDGKPATIGTTDVTRLANGELLYTGLSRSPVCSLLRTTEVNGKPCPVAQEVFATTLDAYLVLRVIAENKMNGSTADGQPATIEHARQRLARMVCADAEELNDDNILAMAEAVAATQRKLIGQGISTLIERQPLCANHFVVTGEGKHLAESIIRSQINKDAIIEELAALIDSQLTTVEKTTATVADSRGYHDGCHRIEQRLDKADLFDQAATALSTALLARNFFTDGQEI